MVDSFTTLFDVIIRIPGLLEDTDNCLAGIPGHEATDLVDHLLLALSDLETWFTFWLGGSDEPAYTVHDISTFPLFFQMVQDRTFAEGFRFSSWMNGYIHSLYWLCGNFSSAALLDLLRVNPGLANPETVNRLRVNIVQNTRSLCKVIPFYAESEGGSIGLCSTFMPLKFAATFFQLAGLKAEYDWCEKVSSSIYRNGIAPPYKLDQESEPWVQEGFLAQSPHPPKKHNSLLGRANNPDNFDSTSAEWTKKPALSGLES